MSEPRVCKTCSHLRRVDLPETREHYYRCGWRESLSRSDFPWAEALLAAGALVKNSGSAIGIRHVEGDWSDAMDCSQWQRDQNGNGTATTAPTVNPTVNPENALDDESEKT